MFADRATISIRSGKGGDGHVSFRRELYVPNGGPDGGDGGRGGDVIFEVDEGLNTLQDYRHRRKYAAKDGEPGGKKRCHGKDADDIVLKVPEGTVIKEAESGKVIADMSGDNRRQVILKGGKGGLGNQHFATATMQIPKYAQPGQNKIDLIYDDGESENPVERLKKEFEPQGIKVFPISGVTGAGIKELLYYVSTEIEKLDVAPIIFEPEYFPDEELINLDLPYTVEKEDDMYIVEGPKIEKMLGYTNLDSEKGFAFFQKFLKDTGILEQLEELGIEEGDTVKMYGLQFDYYK